MVDEQMLAAAETLILYSREPVILPPANPLDLRPTRSHPALARLETIPPSIPSWKGFRSRRSRCSCASKPATEEDESSPSGPAAKTRPSPPTPLEFCAVSAPSTSGSDAAPSSPAIPEPKRRRVGDPSSPSGDACQKVSVAKPPPPPLLVRAAVPSPKPIRRQGKKKTISELQAQERTLAEENAKLRERVAAKRMEMEALMAENRRLMGQKSSLHHSRAADRVAEPRFLLPDLNEPAMEA